MQTLSATHLFASLIFCSMVLLSCGRGPIDPINLGNEREKFFQAKVIGEAGCPDEALVTFPADSGEVAAITGMKGNTYIARDYLYCQGFAGWLSAVRSCA